MFAAFDIWKRCVTIYRVTAIQQQRRQNMSFHEDSGPGSGPGEGAPRRWPRGHATELRFHEGHGPHGHHCGPHGFGPHGRARRGNVKAAILAVLAEQPMHGYEVMQQLESRSGGMWRPSPGSVYPTLQLLEDQGLIKSDDVDGRRVFSLTDEGKVEAETITQQGAPWATSQSGPEGARFKMRGATMQLMAAIRQVGMAGSQEQIDKTLEILAEARKRVYGLLADGE
jgi:DNA-binding PadR family transcriptional regulator